ncbi:hypothetical protein AYO38_00880 [bacterium SCGC AG-212-C10]|nr:hypothetical protein AYO38_00880 [bacterium SCGC AG-212-C10]
MMLRMRLSHMMRLSAGLAVLVPAVALAACGGDKDDKPDATAAVAASATAVVATQPAEAWTDQLCTIWNTYSDVAQQIETVYDGIDPADAKALKAALIGGIQNINAAAAVMNTAAADLPQPAVEGGADIRKTFLDSLASQQERYKRILVEVEKAPDSDTESLSKALEAIPLGDNNLEADLKKLAETYPAAQEAIDLIDARPDACSIIFIA